MVKTTAMALLTIGWVSFASAEGMVMYCGYLLAAATFVLYYRQWIGTRAVEMRKVKAALATALKTIEELTALEAKWRQRADELSTQHSKLHGEYLELRGQFSQLSIAFAKQGETVARIMEELKEERKLRDEQFMQWTRDRAKNGDL